MSKGIAAISAAIDLAQGQGDPIKHIAAVRDLAKECEEIAGKLDASQYDNSGLRMQLMSLHEGIVRLSKELDECYERDARARMPILSASHYLTDDPIHTMTFRVTRVSFPDMNYAMPEEEWKIMEKHARSLVARKMAEAFEKSCFNALAGLPPPKFR